MSLLRRSRRQPGERSAKWGQQLMSSYFGSHPRSLTVSSMSEALRDAANWACIKVKAQGLASMPVDVVRYQGKTRIPVPTPPIIAKPSGVVSRRVWVFQFGASLFSDGNVFGQVVGYDSQGKPTQIELLDPATVTDRDVVGGVVQVKVSGKPHRQYPFGDLWHVPGEFVMPGSPFGLSPIWFGQASTATSLAAERFGGEFFTDGAHPSAVFQPETDPGDKAAEVKQRLVDATRGNRDPLILPPGKFEKLQVAPNDSQFIELMNFEVIQACRRHGVPPSMVYATVSGQNVTYANVTQADLQFLKHTLSYPIDLLEEAQSALLPQPRVVKYNRDAILRADPKARAEVHAIRLANRTTTVNEVRTLEDEEPFGPEFDVPGVPPFQPAPPAGPEEGDTPT